MTTTAPPQQITTSVTLPNMTKEDTKRIADIAKRWKAFRGDLEKPFKKVKEEDPDFNILDNRCGPVVLKGASFLFGKPLTVNVVRSDLPDNGEATGDESVDVEEGDPAEEYLEDCLGDMDDFMTLLSEGAINGGVAGHCFIKLVEKDEASGYDMPRMIVLDPACVWVETDPDDCRCVLAFNIQYDVKDALGKGITKRQRIACEDDRTWSIQNYIQSIEPGLTQQQNTNWQPVGEMILWPYTFPPIAHCPNMPQPNEFWGMPDLTDDIIGMNRHLNLIQSNIAKLLYFYSHPYIFIDAGDGQLPITPGMATGVPQGTNITAVQATGDIANARAFCADLRSDMDELSRVPAVALGRLSDLPRGNISGVALELLFQPLLEKTYLKRRLYGRMIRDVCQWMLALGGIGNGEDIKVDIHWPELLPVDELQTLQALLIKQQLNVSDHTIFDEMNLDYDEQQLLRKQEQEEKQDAFNAGGQAPEASQFGRAPLPPEMTQMQQAMQNTANQPQEGEK